MRYGYEIDKRAGGMPPVWWLVTAPAVGITHVAPVYVFDNTKISWK